ncbi:acyltransferase [Okeania sp. SIO2C9]|uniref:acyltransferase n=1 Tax=Okeania sp. SIO2C9 TaxID=2607791 RepID=UPI0025FE137A|nr:acyltransferase [Okeania sp. SIO2C9]
MTITKIIRRFFIPAPIVSVYYWLKYRAIISPKAEVELNNLLTIGKNTEIASFVKIKASDGFVNIGENVLIAVGCSIASGNIGIEIDNYSMLGPNTSVIGGNYRYDKLDVPIQKQGSISKQGVKIGENVWIGANCCILDGADIGSGTIITPNSVVSSKIPENSIVMGNPAKVIFKRR